MKSPWSIHLYSILLPILAFAPLSLARFETDPVRTTWIQGHVLHHSNVDILFCCVPASPAVGGTEMDTAGTPHRSCCVFFADVSEFQTAEAQCTNISSTYKHTSPGFRIAGSKRCHFASWYLPNLKRASVLWDATKFSFIKCQVPTTVAHDCCCGSIWVKTSAINKLYIHEFSLESNIELSE